MIKEQKKFNKDNDLQVGMFNNNIQQVRMAIRNGADINSMNSNNEPVITWLARKIKYNLANKGDLFFLIDNGANWYIKDKHGDYFIDYLEEDIIEKLKMKYKIEYDDFLDNKIITEFNI